MTYVFLSSTAYLIASTCSTVMEGQLTQPIVLEATLDEAPRAKSPAPFAAFLERNHFKAKIAQAATSKPQIDAVRKQPCPFGQKLLATFVDHENEKSFAAIKLAETGEVIITPGNACHSWEETELGRTRVESVGVVRVISTGERAIKRSEVDRVLSNLHDVLKDVRIIPHFTQKKAAGFRIAMPGKYLTDLGFKKGDVLQGINGFELKDPRDGFHILENVRNAEEITVDLLRRGKRQTLRIVVD